jgi:hypothetical protein
MSVEKVLSISDIQKLRESNIISEQEVAINYGDLYYAKNVLSNEKRMIDASVIRELKQNESVTESKRTLLKG